MTTKVFVVGVNDGVEEYEKEVMDFLANELKKHDILVEKISNSSKVSLLENDDKVILLNDSVRRINPSYLQVVKILYKKEINPLILITHVESEDANPEETVLDFAVATHLIDETVDAGQVGYEFVFLDLNQKAASNNWAHKENDLEELVKSVKYM